MAKPGTVTAEAFLVWGIFYLFFISGLADNLSASHDSINYLYHINRGEHLFHQHHLLYHFLANGWMKLWQTVFPNQSQHHIVEAFTAVWGSAILAVSYLFLRNRFFLTRPLASGGVAVIGFSYGTWFYSINIEVYSPPIFFILCALYVITSKQNRGKDVIAVALFTSMAILFHQVNIIFALVAFFWITRTFKSHLVRITLLYASILAVAVGGVYFITGWFVEGNDNIESFTKWVLGYTVGHNYWQPFGLSSILKAIVGFSRSLIGAQFIFQIPPVKQFLETSLAGHGLTDEVFLTRNISGNVAWLLSAVTIIIGGLFAALVVRFIMAFRRMQLHYHAIVPLVITIICYSLFFLFWMPEILEFWILQMILIWLLLIGTLPITRFPFAIANKVGIFLIAAAMFGVNYFGSIKFLQSFNNDWYYQQVSALNAKPHDLVIIENKWILKDYVRYYKTSNVIASDERQLTNEEMNIVIRKTLAAGGTVYRNIDRPEGGWQTIQSY